MKIIPGDFLFSKSHFPGVNLIPGVLRSSGHSERDANETGDPKSEKEIFTFTF